jgi:hypothetical protein
MAADKGLSPRDFGVKYFDSRKKTRGNRNPIRRRETSDELKKARISLAQDIKDGVHDGLLNRCGISGQHGKFGKEIVAADVKMSKRGGFDILKVLIHSEVRVGMEYNGRTVLSISIENMGANIKMVQMGKTVQPYVHVYRLNLVTT